MHMKDLVVNIRCVFFLLIFAILITFGVWTIDEVISIPIIILGGFLFLGYSIAFPICCVINSQGVTIYYLFGFVRKRIAWNELKYVEDHQPTTFDELESVFPSHIQGSLGVVRRIEDVSDKYKGIGGVKRYFVDDVIYLASGEQVIVCTQFGATNTEKFVEHVTNELGYAIEKE